MATEVCTSTYINDHHDVRALVNYLPLDTMDFGPDNMPAPKKFGDFIESSRYSMLPDNTLPARHVGHGCRRASICHYCS